jgi:ribonuclease-3
MSLSYPVSNWISSTGSCIISPFSLMLLMSCDKIIEHQHILEESLGYSFRNKATLTRALTRKAFAKEVKERNKDQPCEDQEIYRTLGDAVIKTILVDTLVKAGFPSRKEITLKKIELERKETLSELGQELHLGLCIRLNTGEKKMGAEKQPYVIAETLEAIAGAIYLDGGYCSAMDAVIRWYGERIPTTYKAFG